MPRVISLKDELEAALALLRKKGMFRAALRLEKMSFKELHPELFPKEKPPKPRSVRLRGGDGRSYAGGKLTFNEEQE